MGKRYVPLPDGEYEAANPKDKFIVEGPWLTVIEQLTEGKPDVEATIIALSDDYAVCRLEDAPATVELTEERVATLRDVMNLCRIALWNESAVVLAQMLAELEATDANT